MPSVSTEDFAECFGTPSDDLPEECLDYIAEKNFAYRHFDREERDRVMREVLRKTDADQQVIGSQERTEVWEQGWAENLNAFRESGYDLEALRPKFIRSDQPIRFRGDYILPENPQFEYDFMTVFRIWLFKKYFGDCNQIHELGSGTGLNLILLHELYPDKELHGLDFVQPAVDLIDEIGIHTGGNIKGHRFNMTKPDRNYEISDGSGVLTFGAIEQLASRVDPLIDFLLMKRPARVVHVEPTVELYDQTKLLDYLAARFHRKRGYTEGLLPKIQELEKQGKAKILKTRRLNFGSLFMEGYMYYVWEPLW